MSTHASARAMPTATSATVLQRGVFWVSVVNLAWSLAGLIANPSFATGDDLTGTTVLGVDFNGWHAVSGLLAFAPGLVLCRRDDWSRLYALVMIPSIAGPGVWALLDDAPMGIWPFEHASTDAILHFTIAAIYAGLLVVAARRGRTPAG